MGWLSKLNPLNFIESISEGYKAHQKTKAERIKIKGETKLAELEGQKKIAEARIDLQIAQLKTKTELSLKETDQIQDYDMQVLKNRERSYADEFIIANFFFTYIAHFLPWTQPYMAEGWLAMGYDSPPWWLEFGMVLILVSTLGGMRVLKLFLGKFKQSEMVSGESDKK